jgi:hypothetical protein
VQEASLPAPSALLLASLPAPSARLSAVPTERKASLPAPSTRPVAAVMSGSYFVAPVVDPDFAREPNYTKTVPDV